MVCGEECDEKLTIRDVNIVEPVTCCSTCFNLWANNEYDKLTKRVDVRIKEAGVKKWNLEQFLH